MPERLSVLVDLIPQVVPPDLMRALGTRLRLGRAEVELAGVWGSAASFVLAALARACEGPLLAVLSERLEVVATELDLDGLASVPVHVVHKRMRGEGASSRLLQRQEARRIESAGRLKRGERIIVLTTPAALDDALSAGDETSAADLSVGLGLEPQALLARLLEAGYRRVPLVAGWGEAALRGGIVDVFPPGAIHPLRVEFLGDAIESLRAFDVETQRSLAVLARVALPGAAPPDPSQDVRLLDLLPPSGLLCAIHCEPPAAPFPRRLRLHALPRSLAEGGLELGATSPGPLLGQGPERLQQALDRLRELAGTGRVILAAASAVEEERLAAALAEAHMAEGTELRRGIITRSFSRAGVHYIGVGELLGRQLHRRVLHGGPTPGAAPVEVPLLDLVDLAPGDHVVHRDHGIARFLGVRELARGGARQEFLALEFDEGVKLHVPVDRIHLVQRYLGVGGARPRLSRLGSEGWSKRKEKAQRAVQKMAAELLELQATRAVSPGTAFGRDHEWIQAFEDEFPHEETPDQITAARTIAADMARPRPMDRLICGDVGYGKTELAMRAAFTAAVNGAQTAMLVPTTVLAAQHLETFRQRLAAYPIAIAGMSRFQTEGELRRTLEAAREGKLDIVIGTHRLLSRDVSFRNLGLVIIDEEQRFGVEHKERLKALRATVDVLTLTATPIPRTLHLSLLGLRDISALTTAPARRSAIETRLVPDEPALIRDVVRRELERGGQVFYVHNRVYDILDLRDALAALLPGVPLGVVHGQMPERELEAAMDDFLCRRTSVLIATTLIESGLDIPGVNTIIIDEADHYGLADLHQLRGRVGRGDEQGYCYLVVRQGRHPRPEAAARLQALREHSELGAGFRIALRDLEIRGAGNILGAEQSGHVQALGYDLYCELLAEAVRERGGTAPLPPPRCEIELDLAASIPEPQVPDEGLRIGLYRKFRRAATRAQLETLRQELRDFIGPLPPEVETLYRLSLLRLVLSAAGIDRLAAREGGLEFTGPGTRALSAKLAGQGWPARLLSSGELYLAWRERWDEMEQAAQALFEWARKTPAQAAD